MQIKLVHYYNVKYKGREYVRYAEHQWVGYTREGYEYRLSTDKLRELEREFQKIMADRG